MKRLVSWTLASALAGGVAGAGLVIALTRIEAARTPTAPAVTLSDARFNLELTRLLDAIERTLRLLEARSPGSGTPRVPQGQPLPTDKRRAAHHALRQLAEKELRDVLDARQLAAAKMKCRRVGS